MPTLEYLLYSLSRYCLQVMTGLTFFRTSGEQLVLQLLEAVCTVPLQFTKENKIKLGVYM